MTSAALPAALANRRPPTILSCWTEVGSALTRQKPGLRTNLQQAGSCLHPLSPARSIPTPPTAIFAWPLGTDQALEDSLKLPLPSSPSWGCLMLTGQFTGRNRGISPYASTPRMGGAKGWGLSLNSAHDRYPHGRWGGPGQAPAPLRNPADASRSPRTSPGTALPAMHPGSAPSTPATPATPSRPLQPPAMQVSPEPPVQSAEAGPGRAARSPPPTRPGAGAAAPLTRG